MPTYTWKRPLPERPALISFALGAGSWLVLGLFALPSPYGIDVRWVAQFVWKFGVHPGLTIEVLLAGAAIIVGHSGRPYYRSSTLAASGATLGTLFLLLMAGFFIAGFLNFRN